MTPYYEAEGVTLYHADCREPLFSSFAVDLVIADVPYGQTSLKWDRWPTGWLDNMPDNRSLWCFGSLRMFLDHADEFSASGWKLSQDLVWEKHNGSSFHADRFRRVHEQACHFYRGEWDSIYKSTPTTNTAVARTVRTKNRPPHMGDINRTPYESVDGGPLLMRSVMYAPSMHGNAENETQKPETIVAPLIEYGCPKGGSVLSLFSGSGTDLVVARAMGRTVTGIEAREEQCEKAAKRLQQMLPMEFTA